MNSLIHSDWWPLQEEEMGAQTHTETFSLDTERRWPPAGNQYNCTPRLGVQALELWENQFCCSNPIVSGLDCPNKLKSFVYLTSYLRLMSPKTNLKFKCPALKLYEHTVGFYKTWTRVRFSTHALGNTFKVQYAAQNLDSGFARPQWLRSSHEQQSSKAKNWMPKRQSAERRLNIIYCKNFFR